MKSISGRKILMTRIFDETGNQVPVTLMNFEDNIVTQVKNIEKDGYKAIQVGVGLRYRYEQKMSQGGREDHKVGDKIPLEDFKVGEIVNITGISKGKGFAGTVKRHNFNTGPKTHGSNNYRQPGSIGSTDAQRVFKGKRMAGHMGHAKITVKNLKIIAADYDKKQLLIKGAIPGPKKSRVLLWSLK